MLSAEECLEPLTKCGFIHFRSNSTLTYLVPVGDCPFTKGAVAGIYVQSGTRNAPGTSHNAVVFDGNLFSAIKSAEYRVNLQADGENDVKVNDQPMRGKTFSRHKQPNGNTMSIGVSFRNAKAIKAFMEALVFEPDKFNLRGEFLDPLKGSSVEPLLLDALCVETVVKSVTNQLENIVGHTKNSLSEVFLSPCNNFFEEEERKSKLPLIARTLTFNRHFPKKDNLTFDKFKQGITRVLALYCIADPLISDDHLSSFDYKDQAFWSKAMPLFRSMIYLFIARYDSISVVREEFGFKLDFDEICRLRFRLDIPNAGYLNITQLGLLSDRRQSGARGLLYDGPKGERLIDRVEKVPSHSKTGQYLSVKSWFEFYPDAMYELPDNDSLQGCNTGKQYLSLNFHIGTKRSRHDK